MAVWGEGLLVSEPLWELCKVRDKIDYAIVGAGVSGVYIAWRLANSYPKSTIHVFERTDRVGGRLLTAQLPGTSLKAELGGMRYAPSQLIVSNLVEELPLAWEPFEYELNSLHLRGAHIPNSQPNPSVGLPYRLAANEQGKAPADLVKLAIKCALCEVTFGSTAPETERVYLERKLKTLRAENVGISSFSAKEWDFVKQHGMLQDCYLFEGGFWNLLQYYLSNEAFLLAHDGLGYESLVANWNAAEAIPYFLLDFDTTKYRTLKGGMEDLPLALATRFEALRADSLHDNHRVTRITYDGSKEHPFILEYDGEVSGKCRARDVVVAIPKEPLKTLWSNLEGFPAKERGELGLALESVAANPLFKLLLGYKWAWWNDGRAIGACSGRVVTDLPIRQVYYFAPESEQGRAMLMASYSDAHYVDFWRALLARPGEKRYLREIEEGNLDKTRVWWESYGATARMIRKAHRQVRQLYPQLAANDCIPDPYVGLVMDWSQDPYFGGWHSWNVHYEAWKVRRTLRRPFANLGFHICGEAYSCEQGWAEGALRSAELVLKELGTPPPEWLKFPPEQHPKIEGYDDYIGWIE